jgi:hypothetical protein
MKSKLTLLCMCSIILVPLSRSDTLDLTDGSSVNGHVTFNANFFDLTDGQGNNLHVSRTGVTHVEFNRKFTNPNHPPPKIAGVPTNNLADHANAECGSMLTNFSFADTGSSSDVSKPHLFRPTSGSSYCLNVLKPGGLSKVDQEQLKWLALEANAAPDKYLYVITGDEKSTDDKSALDVHEIEDFLTASQVIKPEKLTFESWPVLKNAPPLHGRSCTNCALIQVVSYQGPKREPVKLQETDEVILSNSKTESGVLALITNDGLQLQIGKRTKTYKRSAVVGVAINH